MINISHLFTLMSGQFGGQFPWFSELQHIAVQESDCVTSAVHWCPVQLENEITV